MSTAKAIREREATRRSWLHEALGQLETIPAVVAVWLWGSGGRNEDDALSDWDIFVAWEERSDVAAIDAGWFDRFGEVLWWHEDHHNAPTEGRYISTGYPAPYSPLPIDWYMQPASAAQIGVGTRILLERAPLPRVPVETHELFPMVADRAEFVLPANPVERVQHQLGWFWFMYTPMAKWAARGDEERTRGQIEGLDRVLREAASLAGAAPPAASDGAVFDTVRAMGQAMTGLHPALQSAGVEIPAEVAERLRAYDEANDIRDQEWLR